MKKVLGIDLGVGSIGWALIREVDNKPEEIMAMGVRIIPLDSDESGEFSRGKAISKNKSRTARRSARRRYYRYVLRRTALTKELKKHGMFNPDLFDLPQQQLWELRAKAASERIKLDELGRVLYHLNQKRGYKSAKIGNDDEETKETDYVVKIKNCYQQLKESGLTIGQFFYQELAKNPFYRTKEQVYPREAYIEEYNRIMQTQKRYYPQILTGQLIEHIRDNIIYYQRRLKSQKRLVKVCQFEGYTITTQNGKSYSAGPRVAHKSNPLFQLEKIWETVNHIYLKDRRRKKVHLTLDQKKKLAEYLDNHEKITASKFFDLLDIDPKEYYVDKNLFRKGLKGNLTKVAIKSAIDDKKLSQKWLKMDIKIDKGSDEMESVVNKKSGEIVKENKRKIVIARAQDENGKMYVLTEEPLYQLWHTIYSIPDVEECKQALIKRFGFDDATAGRLANIDFRRFGFGNKSVKAIRKILPYLMEGYVLSDAIAFAGYDHMSTETREERMQRQLVDKIPILKKDTLRQPVVEKILNQLIHLVNDIIDPKRGWVSREERENGQFEIRVELARELKQNKEERYNTFKNLDKIEKENEKIRKELEKMGLSATRKNIIKYRLYHELNNGDPKVLAQCIYTGKMFSLSDALIGNDIDVDHIIPRSLLFDDSQHNKVLTFRQVNLEKGNLTGYDYMASKGEEELKKYIHRVNKLLKEKKISKAKHEKLLMPASEIPDDFINRQIRETQYITRKSVEILSAVCKNVWTTTGGVTGYLRRLWGWNNILENQHIQRIKSLVPDPVEKEILETVTWQTADGQEHQGERIAKWTKRDDHRHHAIDALVVACTKQGYIQRINTLCNQTTRDELCKEVSQRNEKFRESLSLLDQYFITKKPFETSEVEQHVNSIIVSLKPGKKVATWGRQFTWKNGKRIALPKKVLVPRGKLSEESLYGKIKTLERKKPVKYLFQHPELIFKPKIKSLVLERLSRFNGNVKQALKSLETDPIYLDKNRTIKLEYGTCYKEEAVIKVPLEEINLSKAEKIVDQQLKETIINRLKAHNDKPKQAFSTPVYLDKECKIVVRTVRCFARTDKIEPAKRKNPDNPGAYVKPGNNHHIAIYTREDNKKEAHLCTFWHAVDRKIFGLPVVIHNPDEIWRKIEQNEDQYPGYFLEKLPPRGSRLDVSLQENELFILGLDHDTVNRAIQNKQYDILIWHIYRVQKLSMFDIYFRQQFETQVNDNSANARLIKRYIRTQSIASFYNYNPIKIRVNRTGEISIGE